MKLRGVDHRAALPPDTDQAGITKPVEMEGQSIRCQAESFGDAPGRHSFWPGFDEKAKYIQSIFLGEGGESRDGIVLLHVSAAIEMIPFCQEAFQQSLKYFYMRG
jgi:hypothetical protein